MTDARYAKLLRDDADRFAMTVAVVAEADERPPADVAEEALRDALARLTETGALGPDEGEAS